MLVSQRHIKYFINKRTKKIGKAQIISKQTQKTIITIQLKEAEGKPERNNKRFSKRQLNTLPLPLKASVLIKHINTGDITFGNINRTTHNCPVRQGLKSLTLCILDRDRRP